MRHTIKKLIIGLFIITSLSLAGETHAIYSPRIAQEVAQIREHIITAQEKNGTGTLLEATENIIQINRQRREAGQVYGISADARRVQNTLTEQAYEQALQNPFDALFMVFNINMHNQENPIFISNCLRDDIWQLETLRDYVGSEMIKAYMMLDPTNGKRLEKDYEYIIDQLNLLRRYGHEPSANIDLLNEKGELVSISSNEYFFQTKLEDENAVNFYTRKFFKSDTTGCPDGEFEKEIEKIVNSLKTIRTLGSGQGVEWGNIYEMAQARAKERAKQWIRANQLTLSLGGENGAALNSLIQGDGFNQFQANLKTQMRVLENMIGPVTPIFDKSNYRSSESAVNSACAYFKADSGIFVSCDEKQLEQYKECTSRIEKTRKEAINKGYNCDRFHTIDETKPSIQVLRELNERTKRNEEEQAEAKRALTYAITLDSVAEQSIYQISGILDGMNGYIKSGYEGVDDRAGKTIPFIFEELKTFEALYCANKE